MGPSAGHWCGGGACLLSRRYPTLTPCRCAFIGGPELRSDDEGGRNRGRSASITHALSSLFSSKLSTFLRTTYLARNAFPVTLPSRKKNRFAFTFKNTQPPTWMVRLTGTLRQRCISGMPLASVHRYIDTRCHATNTWKGTTWASVQSRSLQISPTIRPGNHLLYPRSLRAVLGKTAIPLASVTVV
jgi:hypothetical protein